MSPDIISINSPPEIPGLTFRKFHGQADYPGMLRVMIASEKADQVKRADTLEDLQRGYSQLKNCDPYQDMLFADVDGDLVGYTRVWWWDDTNYGRVYESIGFLSPEWRRQGIGNTLLRWSEKRLQEIAAGHPSGGQRFFQLGFSEYQTGGIALAEKAGYQPFRYWNEMVRPNLDDIPDYPLPPGIEVRPAQPEHYRAIWINVDDTSQDEWPYTPTTEADYQAWQKHPHFQPELWQIAWDVAAERVVGHVLTFIDPAENKKFNRTRGYTEGIGVDRAWRRRGLAKALIVRSLRAQKAAEMTESTLVADSDSSSGVLRLYESCGFQVVQRDPVYRKAFQLEPSETPAIPDA